MDPNLQTINTGAFGNLHILQPLGEGGMATVYLAELQGQGGFRSKVALKVIQPHLALLKPELRQWFADEARLGGLLRHDNVVQTQFFGEQEGMLYLAMEYVDGPSLHKVLNILRRQQEYMPPSIAIQIMEGVCDGMIHAHEARDANGQPLRMVHRDLKPSNVMFTSGGLVKVCDFGVARAESNDNRTMFAGQAKGTARYMSPEQAYGDLDLDCRSDIFTLGAIFYELITLMPLYEGDNPQRLLRMAQDANVGPRIEAIPAHIPERALFVSFFQRALARDVGQRFQTTREMLTALEDMVDRLPRGPVLKRWLNRFEEPQPQAGVAVSPSAGGASLPSDASLKSHASRTVPPAHQSIGQQSMAQQSIGQQSMAQQSMAQQSMAQQSMAQQSMAQQSMAGSPVSSDATVAPSPEVLARMANRSLSRAQAVPPEPMPVVSDATMPPPAHLLPQSGRTPLPQQNLAGGAARPEFPAHPAFSEPSGPRRMPSTPGIPVGIPSTPSSMGLRAHPSQPGLRAMPSQPGIPVNVPSTPSSMGLKAHPSQPGLRAMPSQPGIQAMPRHDFPEDVRATTVFPTQRPPVEFAAVEPAPQSLMGETPEEVFNRVRTSGVAEAKTQNPSTFAPPALPTVRIQAPPEHQRPPESLYALSHESSRPPTHERGPSQERTVELDRPERSATKPVQPIRPTETPAKPVPAPPSESGRPAWMLPALGGGALLVVGVLAFAFMRGPKEVEVKPSATPVAIPATPAPVVPTPMPSTPAPTPKPAASNDGKQAQGNPPSDGSTTKGTTASNNGKPLRPTPVPDTSRTDGRNNGRGDNLRPVTRPTETPAKPPTRGGTGLLTVNSRPSSSVMIDGRPKAGSLPIQNIPLSAGKHTLYFSRPEQKPAETVVEIPDGGSVSCVASFADASGVELDQPYVRCRTQD
ncbi:MAG: protein kinase domain-containing protein [Myxococcota bacterium]